MNNPLHIAILRVDPFQWERSQRAKVTMTYVDSYSDAHPDLHTEHHDFDRVDLDAAPWSFA